MGTEAGGWRRQQETILARGRGIGLFLLLLSIPLTAQAQLLEVKPVRAATMPVPQAVPASVFSFQDLDLHPDVMYQPFTAGALLADADAQAVQTIMAFRALVERYAIRQGLDDNFTIRVTDSRTDELLELYVLEAERRAFEATGEVVWSEIDRKRRQEMHRLIDKYVQRGVPKDAISVRWGRAHQVREARDAEAPYIEYEMRLARYLGLSLLATEIGTVETFNQDEMVSSVGARGRYQMMPSVLRRNGIKHYRLRTASGRSVPVFEEWHPLMTMEPAFLTLRGYANAVGHEIPGLSAYHAGPGNIFRIYRLFMEEQEAAYEGTPSVVDAYLWAITDGFDRVSRGSSFGRYSQGYVPSVYGSLRAAEAFPIDTTYTLEAERVQVRPGKSIYLSQLLRVLEAAEERLDWGRGEQEPSLYQRFRMLNPHFSLPEVPARLGSGGGVPVYGDVRLTARAEGAAVRFFLPLGTTQYLAEVRMDLLDEARTFRFDRALYADPAGEKTEWDRDYEALVREIAGFGFTRAQRQRLRELRAKFEALAAANPSPYRLAQLTVIRLHDELWDTSPWEKLSDVATRYQARR